jgi:hypothetical protein
VSSISAYLLNRIFEVVEAHRPHGVLAGITAKDKLRQKG